MKVSELKRKVSKQGCRLERHGGKHDIWVNPKTGQTAEIPRHDAKEIKTGTAQKILKDLGLK